MKASDVVAEIRKLAAAFPRSPVPAETVAIYAAALCDLEPAQLAGAVAKAILCSPFFPSIAELRTFAAESCAALPDAESVLGEILEAIRSRGWIDPPKAGELSPVAEATVAVVGWDTLCRSENIEADRAHLLRIAATMRKRAVERVNLGSAGLPAGVPCPPLERALPIAQEAKRPAELRLGAGLGSVLEGFRPKETT